MSWSATSLRRLSRRTMLRATGGVAAAAIARVDARSARAVTSKLAEPLFQVLDDKIEAAMARYHVPGVAVGVLHDGREYVRGYGVTNVDYPLPVDGDTLFRVGSTTKTFTGTAVMRLVEAGKLDLHRSRRALLTHRAPPSGSGVEAVTGQRVECPPTS
jgi:CubicO group peptidase (beta-lactamase class C family)